MDLVDPAFLERDDVRAALAARDVGTVYRLLWRSGVSQHQIARLTDQSQSEVSEILKGRQVRDVRVLERIADGLGIPRARIGLSYGEQQEPDTPSVEEEMDEDVKRRILLAATSTTALGQAFPGRSELPLPTSQALPSRLSMSHVHEVRTFTDRLVGMARYYGGQANHFGTAVTLYTPWMQIPTHKAIKAQLAAALADLHSEAGWACYDCGLDGRGYFTRGLQLAGEGEDTYGITKTAWTAGATLVRAGHPNDALKLFQLGSFSASKSTRATPRPDDPRLPTITAFLNLNSATAYALMDNPHQATHHLAQAHDGWEPRDAFERAAMDRATAGIHLDLGQLDTAEQYATSARHTYNENHRRGRTLAALLLAEIHIRAGEPQGLTLARQAIEEVSTLHSLAARQERLIPLAAALEARPSTDTRELARRARQIAETRI